MGCGDRSGVVRRPQRQRESAVELDARGLVGALQSVGVAQADQRGDEHLVPLLVGAERGEALDQVLVERRRRRVVGLGGGELCPGGRDRGEFRELGRCPRSCAGVVGDGPVLLRAGRREITPGPQRSARWWARLPPAGRRSRWASRPCRHSEEAPWCHLFNGSVWLGRMTPAKAGAAVAAVIPTGAGEQDQDTTDGAGHRCLPGGYRARWKGSVWLAPPRANAAAAMVSRVRRENDQGAANLADHVMALRCR